MFFKRIEIVGFKSFATRTVFDFIPGTTVIVGPNGCGKSNILDAIKWVLGEQSPSQMRGKRMQDVIFAGSASFKPLGVAQITLTIDNRQRILPTDFDEVQITRRLFRSGESEYLLNKQACRLRDIYDLFLGTGIGKSAYSVLEQGRVDQIINAKPIDRRFIIEEAAGISKFKIRKLEALRKLERTDIDLARLNDLMSEVERQVG
jgi:chromosome segregation protein